MKILLLVERPTQFDAPFFRYVAAHHREDTLKVVFSAPDPEAPIYDPELGHDVDFRSVGLLEGYDYFVLSAAADSRQWLKAELGREDWDLLITNGYKEPYYDKAVEWAHQQGIPTALRLDAVGDGWLARRHARRLRFVKSLKRRYDVFLAVGNRTLDFLKSCGIDDTRSGLFPYAVDIKYFRAASSRISAAKRKAYRRKHEVPARAKVVLAVAKLNRREAPWDLIKALPHLGSKVQLWVAGDGPVMRKLELETKTERHRVKLLGYIQYPELPALYAAADLFVHTAREEHWGVSIGEAMACDLPVIASSGVGAGDDLIKPGINGHVYPAGKPKRLAHFIEKALKLGPGDVKDANRKILADWEYLAAWKELTKATKKARDWVNRERR